VWGTVGSKEAAQPRTEAIRTVGPTLKKEDAMEVFEAVRTALAIRNYKETPIPADVMRKIVEAAVIRKCDERSALAFHCGG